MKPLCLASILIAAPAALAQPLSTALTIEQKGEVDNRLERFYSPDTDTFVMDRSIPKWDAFSGTIVRPNPVLKIKRASQLDPLLESAQAKALPGYQTMRCQKLLRNRQPWLDCNEPRTWETATPNDRVEDLTNTWVRGEKISRDLDELPLKGQVSTAYWSGEYWRMQWGLTSYRYAGDKQFSNYRDAVADYAQPKDWIALAGADDPESLIADWSPAEKYDLTVGDTGFALTNQQKNEGKRYLGADGNVESWFGLCHGWAAAALFVPSPMRTVTSLAPDGKRVLWYPDDVRAMATLAWANGNFPTNFIGGRCRAQHPARYANGRLVDESCFDNNPATMTAVLGNMIGKSQRPFVMDSTFDYQVWNQPVVAYELRYFNPLSPGRQSDDWRRVAVAYDDSFKKQDRFQKPLTRGIRSADERYDDTGIKSIVGVTATLVFLAENSATQEEVPSPNTLTKVTYTYDLELHEKDVKLVALGGEWHENAHPDFLWIPQRGAVADAVWDRTRVHVDLAHAASRQETSLAKRASRAGYPLCEVLERLVHATAGAGSDYRCLSAR